MRCIPLVFFLAFPALFSQTIPTFTDTFVTNGQQFSYTMAGQKPESGSVTTIPTVVIPVSLVFASRVAMDATPVISQLLQSPVFQPYAFANGKTQYADAVQRAQFAQTAEGEWHTVLAQPSVARTIRIDIPVGNGYLLHSRRTRKSLAVVDLDFLQKQGSARASRCGTR